MFTLSTRGGKDCVQEAIVFIQEILQKLPVGGRLDILSHNRKKGCSSVSNRDNTAWKTSSFEKSTPDYPGFPASQMATETETKPMPC